LPLRFWTATLRTGGVTTATHCRTTATKPPLYPPHACALRPHTTPPHTHTSTAPRRKQPGRAPHTHTPPAHTRRALPPHLLLLYDQRAARAVCVYARLRIISPADAPLPRHWKDLPSAWRRGRDATLRVAPCAACDANILPLPHPTVNQPNPPRATYTARARFGRRGPSMAFAACYQCLLPFRQPPLPVWRDVEQTQPLRYSSSCRPTTWTNDILDATPSGLKNHIPRQTLPARLGP